VKATVVVALVAGAVGGWGVLVMGSVFEWAYLDGTRGSHVAQTAGLIAMVALPPLGALVCVVVLTVRTRPFRLDDLAPLALGAIITELALLRASTLWY